eukprot:6208873-Pleurochrysis_carterae.AAC.6
MRPCGNAINNAYDCVRGRPEATRPNDHAAGRLHGHTRRNGHKRRNGYKRRRSHAQQRLTPTRPLLYARDRLEHTEPQLRSRHALARGQVAPCLRSLAAIWQLHLHGSAAWR